MTDDELFKRLRRELKAGWIPIPDERGWMGTDAPGKLLRHRLGFPGSSYPGRPNLGEWHLRFFGGASASSLLTLFGSMGEPRGYLEDLLLEFGQSRADGRLAFIHTIHGSSDRGLYVVSEDERVAVRHDDVQGVRLPSWTHSSLRESFAQKYERLIVVRGDVKKAPRRVAYRSADVYLEPRINDFPAAVAEGRVAIEFNMKTKGASSIRDHGPRFRVRLNNLHSLYARHISL